MSNKTFLFLLGFLFGMVVTDIIDVHSCNNKGIFISYFNGKYTCEKIEK